MTTTKPNMLEFTKDISLAVANFYEYSMAQANLLEGIVGKETVFDVVVRNLPTNKIVGKFEFDGVKYEKLAKRNFLINCGIEQCLAYFLESKGNTQLRNYLEITGKHISLSSTFNLQKFYHPFSIIYRLDHTISFFTGLCSVSNFTNPVFSKI